jgi:trimeric autotransporter adhesin
MKFFPALQIGYAWLYNLKAGLVTQASTAAYESAPLGAELLSADGWTSTDWTGDWASGWDHTTGNTTALLNSLAAVSGNYYQIAYTVTGRTAGTFTITFGGVTSEAISATGAWGPKATSTGSLSITPTSTFDGTIVISIKQITGTYAPVYRILNSAAGSALEIRSTTNALCNTFIGIGVGRYNTTGGYNTALGYLALYYNTTGNYNTALGAKAFYSNTTGNYNTALGALALFSNTTGSYNTALGYQALFSNTTGSYNTAFGYLAFYSNTTGNYNTALGAQAFYSNTTGSYNTALGYQALFSNTTGSYNTAFGYLAFYSNTTGNYNTALGALALFSNTTGGYNTAFGYLALYSNTTGGYNTALGYQALYSNTTGGYNTAFGYLAGRYISSGAANQTSGNSVYLGYDTRSSADGNTNETVLGNTAVGNGSNTVTLGNTSVTGWYMGATKLIGAQGAAVDDATGAGDVVAQLNALLARIRAHGLIAT